MNADPNQNLLDLLRPLEESLWRAETRFDRPYLERILAPNFFEFGRSGRVYTREEIIHAPVQPIRCRLPLKNFQLHRLSPLVVLVTYLSEVLYAEWEYANRSSVWVESPTGWQLRFHQGTPVPQDLR